MSKVKIAALVFLGLVAALLLFAATRPDTFRVERSVVMAASPDTIFNVVNDFHHWPLWSPWEERDPSMQRTHSGTESGVGAVYSWSGNSDVGSGRMEITESVPGRRVVIKLDFMEPWESSNTTEFSFEPTADGTQVTWAMHGSNNFMGKLMSVFMDMDGLIGGDFEAGLAKMRAAVGG